MAVISKPSLAVNFVWLLSKKCILASLICYICQPPPTPKSHGWHELEWIGLGFFWSPIALGIVRKPAHFVRHDLFSRMNLVMQVWVFVIFIFRPTHIIEIFRWSEERNENKMQPVITCWAESTHICLSWPTAWVISTLVIQVALCFLLIDFGWFWNEVHTRLLMNSTTPLML